MTVDEWLRNNGREEGLEIGREEGLEIGREEGLEIGREEGMGLGAENKATEVVRNLLNCTEFTLEKIASIANVSADFVMDVKNKLNGAI